MYDSYRPPTQFSVFPPVIKNLLIINGLFFLAKYVAAATNALGIAYVLNMLALYPPGGPPVGPWIFPGFQGPVGFWPWQLVTYSFLHGGIAHIFFNMLALWMFGVQIENSWGSRRFALFYFVCVIGAGLLQIIVMWGTSIPTVGASGGIFGVLLAFGMMFPNQYIMMLFPPIPMKAKYFVILYGAVELFAGVTGSMSGVAHFAHLGGMLFGFVLIQYWRGRLPLRPKHTMYW